MMCLNHVTMKSESCMLFGTTCSTTHMGSCMPSISVLVLIGAQNVETALDLLGIRYIHQMHMDGDIKDVAKSAVKCLWASIATRTKKAAALVRQSEHAVRYFRDASMPNAGTEITGTFGYHADIFRTQAGGRYPWLLPDITIFQPSASGASADNGTMFSILFHVAAQLSLCKIVPHNPRIYRSEFVQRGSSSDWDEIMQIQVYIYI